MPADVDAGSVVAVSDRRSSGCPWVAPTKSRGDCATYRSGRSVPTSECCWRARSGPGAYQKSPSARAENGHRLVRSPMPPQRPERSPLCQVHRRTSLPLLLPHSVPGDTTSTCCPGGYCLVPRLRLGTQYDSASLRPILLPSRNTENNIVTATAPKAANGGRGRIALPLGHTCKTPPVAALWRNRNLPAFRWSTLVLNRYQVKLRFP
jgi:hypothetical protein